MRVGNKPNAKNTLAALSMAVFMMSLARPDATADDSRKYPILRQALAPERSGCTVAQVSDKDPKLEGCYRAQENDVLNNRPYKHFVFCTTGARSCCQVDNRTGATSNCVIIHRGVKSQDAAGPPLAPRPGR